MKVATIPDTTGRTMRAGCGGDVRPQSTEEAVRLAHTILSDAGVNLPPSKIARLCRDYLRVVPPISFRAYLVRNARPSVASLPRPTNRHGVEWLDPTGDTATANVDRRSDAHAAAAN